MMISFNQLRCKIKASIYVPENKIYQIRHKGETWVHPRLFIKIKTLKDSDLIKALLC